MTIMGKINKPFAEFQNELNLSELHNHNAIYALLGQVVFYLRFVLRPFTSLVISPTDKTKGKSWKPCISESPTVKLKL